MVRDLRYFAKTYRFHRISSKPRDPTRTPPPLFRSKGIRTSEEVVKESRMRVEESGPKITIG